MTTEWLIFKRSCTTLLFSWSRLTAWVHPWCY